MGKKISVIIPMYNASVYIEACLSAVARQSIKDLEVLLVDDLSVDDTVAKAEKFPFRIIRLAQRGRPAKVRNEGAKASSGDILVFLDSDVVLEADSVERITSRLAGADTDAVSAIYSEDIPYPDFLNQFQNLLNIYEFLRPPAITTFLFSCFCAIKREAFEAAGGFDEGLIYCEDVKIGRRLIEKGYKCRMDTSVRVTHLKRYDHAGMVRDHFKKLLTIGAHFRRSGFKELLKNDAIPMSIKAAALFSGPCLLSLPLTGLSPVPLAVSLAGYSFSILPFLAYLAEMRGAWFAVKAYFASFEVFLISQSGFLCGIVMGDKNG